MKYFCNFFTILIFSVVINCLSPEQRATKNAAINLCPNLGILDLKDINQDSLLSENREVAAKTKSGDVKIYHTDYFFNAKQIFEKYKYDTFMKIYDEICDGQPPFNNEIPFIAISKEKENEQLEKTQKRLEALTQKITDTQKQILNLKNEIDNLSKEMIPLVEQRNKISRFFYDQRVCLYGIQVTRFLMKKNGIVLVKGFATFLPDSNSGFVYSRECISNATSVLGGGDIFLTEEDYQFALDDLDKRNKLSWDTFYFIKRTDTGVNMYSRTQPANFKISASKINQIKSERQALSEKIEPYLNQINPKKEMLVKTEYVLKVLLLNKANLEKLLKTDNKP